MSLKYIDGYSRQAKKASAKLLYDERYPLIGDKTFELVLKVIKVREAFVSEKYADVPRVSRIRNEMKNFDYVTESYQWWCGSEFGGTLSKVDSNRKRSMHSTTGLMSNRIILGWIENLDRKQPLGSCNLQGCLPTEFVATIMMGNESRVDTASIHGIVFQLISDIDAVKQVENWTWRQVKMIFQTIQDIACNADNMANAADNEDRPKPKLYQLLQGGNVIFNLLFNVVAAFWRHGFQQKVMYLMSEVTDTIVSCTINEELAKAMSCTWEEVSSIKRVIMSAFYRFVSEDNNELLDEITIAVSIQGRDHFQDLCRDVGVVNRILRRCEVEVTKLLLLLPGINVDNQSEYTQAVKDGVNGERAQCQIWVSYLLQIFLYSYIVNPVKLRSCLIE